MTLNSVIYVQSIIFIARLVVTMTSAIMISVVAPVPDVQLHVQN
jgi:hypothetical protein